MNALIDDIKRYKNDIGGFAFYEPSLIIIVLYRLGNAIKRIKLLPLKFILTIIVMPFYSIFSVLIGIHIPRSAHIGPGLRIYHYGCIFINPKARIGSNCTMRQGVTIGSQRYNDDVPIIGDNVEIGAGAKILGNIKIGDNVIIGANAVVISNIPSNSIAVGVPARAIMRRKEKQ